MTFFLQILFFLIGVFFSINIIAACYSILDLWYTIRTAYKGVILRLAFWGIATGFLILILYKPNEKAFIWGILGYAGYYLLNITLANIYKRSESAQSHED